MSTYGSQLERSISRLPQVDYATARAAGDAYRRIVSESRSIISNTTNFVDDAGYDNGSDVASEKWAETSDGQGQLNPLFCFQDVGYFWLWALGGYSVSGPDGGLYTHTFTPQNMNTSRQLPVRTLLEKWGGLKLRMIPSVMCSGFKISGAKSGRLKTSASVMGSGAFSDDPPSYVSPALVNDREYGYSGQAAFSLDDKSGTKQKETATATGSATSTGNALVTVTAVGMLGSPVGVSVQITSGDSASAWAAKVRTALRANTAVSAFFDITGSGTSIVAEARRAAANDVTMNIQIAANGTGITDAPTSANTTAGVVGNYQPYSCELENWEISLDNPMASDGYRQCSPYLIPGIPESGTVRSEALVGARKYGLSFGVRLLAGDKMRGWMLNGTPLRFEHYVIGKEISDFSQRIVHTACRVTGVEEGPESADGFFGLNGTVDLMSDPTISSGAIPLTVTLVNNVPSYTS